MSSTSVGVAKVLAYSFSSMLAFHLVGVAKKTFLNFCCLSKKYCSYLHSSVVAFVRPESPGRNMNFIDYRCSQDVLDFQRWFFQTVSRRQTLVNVLSSYWQLAAV